VLFADDLDYQGLDSALEKSCRYYDNAPERSFEVCGQHLSGRELSRAYSQIISSLDEQPDQDIGLFLANNFTLCPPASLLITGYYTPILSGSLSPTSTYYFPLYTLPGQEELRTLSRAEIDNGTLLKGHAIAYLASPVDLFFLHVQGSGILKLPDGSRRLIAYAGDNGRPYTSIGKILIQEGKLQSEEVSLATISDYLARHPDQRQRILNQNERYIFFRLSDPEAGTTLPSGSLGYPLTPDRSVALDAAHYPPGILGMLTGIRPHLNKSAKISWQPFSRLVTHQDSGAAIKGPQRLDLYIGSGEQAGQVAGLMKEKGSFAILIPNLSLR
jgi:membrane-bound lytic murein transglycosylase A